MAKKEYSEFVFDLIAPIYGLYYNRQKGRYRSVLESLRPDFDIAGYRSVLDVGCGTGAFAAVVGDMGLDVTGIDPSERMLRIARRKNVPKSVTFLSGDVLKRLPFADKSFDVATAFYVAHGMTVKNRQVLYDEMNRVSRHWVALFDYNGNRALLTSVIECLERGDYFQFIRSAERELRDRFKEVTILNAGKRASLYLCRAVS
jgi:ubiquinone/menaquinone biosynthesis C-methylase UbiE